MLGRRLTELRRKLKLSQEKVAEQLDISRSAYSNYEAGNREPDHKMTDRLAEYFGVTVDYLLGRTNDPSHTLSEDAAQIVDLLNYTDDEILQSKVVLKVDGRELTDDEIIRFIAYVRTERQMKGLK